MSQESVHLMSYDRGDHCIISDHKPVRALMNMNVKKVNWASYEQQLIDTFLQDCKQQPYSDLSSFVQWGIKPLVASPMGVKLQSLGKLGDRKPLTLVNQLPDKSIYFVISGIPNPSAAAAATGGIGSATGGDRNNIGGFNNANNHHDNNADERRRCDSETSGSENNTTTAAAGYPGDENKYPLPPWLRVQPMHGMLAAGEQLTLTVWNSHEKTHLQFLYDWEAHEAYSVQKLPSLGPLLRLPTNDPEMEISTCVRVQGIVVSDDSSMLEGSSADSMLLDPLLIPIVCTLNTP